MEISAATQQLTQLLQIHLADLFLENPAYVVRDAGICGRGVFAARDINAGEIIFRERPLLFGPTARKEQQLYTCIICHQRIQHETLKDCVCAAGCALPVCGDCSGSAAHANECVLYRKWKPKNPHEVDLRALRILAVVRCCFLNEQQRKLLYALQANNDKYYLGEIERAAECFEHFPKDVQLLEYFYRTIRAFNTNAFEGCCRLQGNEVVLRALFPLAGLLNHQCLPNASHHFENVHTIVMLATRPIAQGDEICVTYTKLLWGNLPRRAFLSMTKHFICKCERCLDPTENGTYLSALFCRAAGCKGIVIPVHTKTLQPDWRCLNCEQVFPHAKMARYQDFALNTINNRINNCNISDMIRFINELCPRFCPPSNYVLIEAKLNIIWRMSRSKQPEKEFTPDELQHRDQYRNDILQILQKLGAGECTLKKLITEEIE